MKAYKVKIVTTISCDVIIQADSESQAQNIIANELGNSYLNICTGYAKIYNVSNSLIECVGFATEEESRNVFNEVD